MPVIPLFSKPFSLFLQAAFLFVLVASGSPLTAAAPTDPARGAGESRTPYYLPHQTWEEVEHYLRDSDMVIIPLGSTEQHGKHLPLLTDTVQAVEISLKIGQKAKVLVAPVVLAGISDHHMAFPGTITLSSTTFEAVLWDTAQSLITHGFRRFLFYNNHGGNGTAMANVIHRINHETVATAIDLGSLEFPPLDPKYPIQRFDWHAGVEESSNMLFLAPGLVQMAKAENAKITFPPQVQAIEDRMKGADRDALLMAMLFHPTITGKKTSTKDLTPNGVFSPADVKTSTPEIGRAVIEPIVETVAKFIEAWRAAVPRVK